MKYKVYCLISDVDSKFHYYGFTSDLKKRLEFHKKGKVKTTKRFLPLQLLGYKEFEDKKEALVYEKRLKKVFLKETDLFPHY